MLPRLNAKLLDFYVYILSTRQNFALNDNVRFSAMLAKLIPLCFSRQDQFIFFVKQQNHYFKQAFRARSFSRIYCASFVNSNAETSSRSSKWE